MYNLETIGLILLLGLAISVGGLYLKYAHPQKIQKKPLPTPEEAQDDNFETAVEFFPDIEFPPDPVKEKVPELPWGYDDNKLTVMARDPKWVFAYWDISEDKRQSLRDTHGPDWDKSHPVLRVYDVTGVHNSDCKKAKNFFDVSVNEHTGKWYVNVGAANRAFCMELGRILSDGNFIIMARSNITSTPRNTISDKIDPDWMLVSENERRLLARLGQMDDSYSSAHLVDRNLH